MGWVGATFLHLLRTPSLSLKPLQASWGAALTPKLPSPQAGRRKWGRPAQVWGNPNGLPELGL